ncbi:MAG: methyltransferase domain-containing protein [Hyphomicrobiaceae bacterium]|nr:methyltransferase domain-containing protein [Hyphomicrobiaceae bacterium]
MSGFSPEWLALREPADHGAVNAQVRAACVRALAGREFIRVVDLGCGTGSNLRSLAPLLPPRQHWTLVDHDQRLLQAARAREMETVSGGVEIEIEYRQADLSGGGFGALIEGADLVTASALFDLVSVAVMDGLAADVAAAGAAFYTVLSYDGIAAFLPEHPADPAMRETFNRHQQTDKGFGPAAGPDATEALAAAFALHGYAIRRGRSPWILDSSHSALRRELERGWAAAVRETGLIPSSTIDGWMAHRTAAAGAVTIVGHEDLLALPPVT